MIDVAAAIASVVNAGWGLRMESKSAAVDARVDGIEKLCDERHDVVIKRLDRLEGKIDILIDRDGK